MENNNLIGKRINSALVLRDKKQKELAEYLGVKPNVVSYFCKGSRVPNIEQIRKIAEFFDVSSDYLLGLSDIATADADLIGACKFTGLDEETIMILKMIVFISDVYQNDSILNVFETIVKHKELIRLLRNCMKIKNCSDDFVKTVLERKKDYETFIEQTDLYLFRAIESFRKILETMINPAYDKAKEYTNKYCIWQTAEGINDGKPFMPLTPPALLRAMMPPYPITLPAETIEELKKNEPTQEEIDQYNRNLDYYNKMVEQADKDLAEIKKIFDEKELNNNAQHNPPKE